jgi:opacity protein-like surface antigen
MKKFAAAAVVIAVALAFAMPARAVGVVATTKITMTLPVFPGLGSVSSMSGTITGVGTWRGAVSLGPGGISYSETSCFLGGASGNIQIGPYSNLSFGWRRVGNTANLTISGGGQQGLAVATYSIPAKQLIERCLPGGAGPVTVSIVALGVSIP